MWSVLSAIAMTNYPDPIGSDVGTLLTISFYAFADRSEPNDHRTHELVSSKVLAFPQHRMALLSVDPIRVLVGAALFASVLALIYARLFHKKSPYPLPPGPPGKFLVGNLGQLSIDHPEEDYIRWGKEYSRSDIPNSERAHLTICQRLRCDIHECDGPAHDQPQQCQGRNRSAGS